MTHTEEDTQLVHELDVAWIIALWIFIHGGDPAPGVNVEKSAALVAAGLAEYFSATLSPMHRVLTLEQLQAKLAPLGIQVQRGAPRHEADLGQPAGIPVRPYCFTWEGKQYCIQIRTHVPPPPG